MTVRTVAYKSLLEGTLRLAGVDPAAVTASDKVKIMEYLAQALREAHEFWAWPELSRIELRYFRPVWFADDYAQDCEVYHAATDAYYRAAEDLGATAVPGVATGWVRLETLDRYVAWRQEGMVAIEAALGAWDRDPREHAEAMPLDYETGYEGVRFAPSADVPSGVWLEYRVACPDFTYAAEWTPGAWAAGTQVYHPASGELYQASDDVTTEVPGVAPEWVPLEVPYPFATACKRWAHALYAGSDGANRKGLMTQEEFQDLLEEQVWQFTKLQGQTGRVTRRP